MKNVLKILILFLSITLFSCGGEDDNYKTFDGPEEALLFVKLTSVLEVTASAATSVDILIGSTTKSNVDRVIPISISPTSTASSTQYVLSATSVTIPAGQNVGKVTVRSADFNSLPLSGGRNLVLVFGAGTGYKLPTRTNHVVSIERGCLNVKADLDITFDPYASEISWNVRNSSNAVIASSTGYTDGLASFKQRLCLTPGNYTFTMDDSYGDGIAPGNFAIKLVNGGTILVSGSVFLFTTGPLPFTINP